MDIARRRRTRRIATAELRPGAAYLLSSVEPITLPASRGFASQEKRSGNNSSRRRRPRVQGPRRPRTRRPGPGWLGMRSSTRVRPKPRRRLNGSKLWGPTRIRSSGSTSTTMKRSRARSGSCAMEIRRGQAPRAARALRRSWMRSPKRSAAGSSTCCSETGGTRSYSRLAGNPASMTSAVRLSLGSTSTRAWASAGSSA